MTIWDVFPLVSSHIAANPTRCCCCCVLTLVVGVTHGCRCLAHVLEGHSSLTWLSLAWGGVASACVLPKSGRCGGTCVGVVVLKAALPCWKWRWPFTFKRATDNTIVVGLHQPNICVRDTNSLHQPNRCVVLCMTCQGCRPENKWRDHWRRMSHPATKFCHAHMPNERVNDQGDTIALIDPCRQCQLAGWPAPLLANAEPAHKK